MSLRQILKTNNTGDHIDCSLDTHRVTAEAMAAVALEAQLKSTSVEICSSSGKRILSAEETEMANFVRLFHHQHHRRLPLLDHTPLQLLLHLLEARLPVTFGAVWKNSGRVNSANRQTIKSLLLLLH